MNEKEIPRIKISEIDLNNALFHFHPKEFHEEVKQKGLEPRIGSNAKGIEQTEKIFFSKGLDGVLKLWDVWIKWEMKHAFNGDDKYPELFNNNNEILIMKDYWTKYYPVDGNAEEIKLFFQNIPKEYKEKFFSILIKSKIENQEYYILDIEDGKEYDSNDIDEIKQKLKNDYDKIDKQDYPSLLKQQKKINHARVLYGSYSKNDIYMDNWNMHTKTGISIDKDKIKLLQTETGATDVLTILIELYDISKYIFEPSYFEQFDILEVFIDYAKKELNQDYNNEQNKKIHR